MLQVEKGRSKKCCYCSRSGATARCDKKACRAPILFGLGQESGTTFQFVSKMLVFCAHHGIKQKVETVYLTIGTLTGGVAYSLRNINERI